MEKKKKPKPLRPFRIKRSSIVSIRSKHYYESSSSSTASTFRGRTSTSTITINSKSKSKSKNKTYWHWLEPIPNQDDTITLIGRKIKCSLPKSIMMASSSSSSSSSSPRVLEGEVIAMEERRREDSRIVISLLVHKNVNANESVLQHIIHNIRAGPGLQNGIKNGHDNDNNNNNRKDDRTVTTTMPMPILRVQNHQELSSSSNHDATNTKMNISQIERQRRIYEERVRGGKNEAISILTVSLPLHQTKNDIRWVIYKPSYLPASSSLSSSSNSTSGGTGDEKSYYVGDGNDDESQQIKNARWVTNFHPMTQAWCNDHVRVGEVVDVIPIKSAASATSTGGSSKEGGKGSSSPSSLAKVILRPLKFIEDTVTGRMVDHHFWNELCDCDLVIHEEEADDNANGKKSNAENDNAGSGDSSSSLGGRKDIVGRTATVTDTDTGIPKSSTRTTQIEMQQTIEVPIEDLIVIGKKAKRFTNPNAKAKDLEFLTESDILIRYKYDPKLQLFEPLNLDYSKQHQQQQQQTQHPQPSPGRLDLMKRLQMCHRCHCLDHERRMGQCQSKSCSSESSGGQVQNNENGNATQSSSGNKIGVNLHTKICNRVEQGQKWWCRSCIRLLRKRGTFVLRKGEPFYGPCCLGNCDCKFCVKKSMVWEGQQGESASSFQKIMVDSCKNANARIRKAVVGNGIYYDSDSPSSSTADPNQGNKWTSVACMNCTGKCETYGIQCSTCARLLHNDCFDWEHRLFDTNMGTSSARGGGDSSPGPLCYQCKRLRCTSCDDRNIPNSDDGDNIYDLTVKVLELMPPAEFCLPFNLLDNLPKPALKPQVNSTLRPPKRQKMSSSKRRKSPTQKLPKKLNPHHDLKSDPPEMPVAAKEAFVPTASRIVPYDPSTKLMRSANNSAAHAAKSIATMRSGGRKTASRNKRVGSDNKSSSSRAARANQRRMLKDTWITGGVKEALSGCEHALRFGKSIIHGWGVFTDEEINAGDLIVEYRRVQYTLFLNCTSLLS